MSASLVGSEMCIRDRCTRHRPTCALPAHADQCAGLSTSAPPICEVAVSYTHLTLPTICSV
eukprot:12465607-Alexandrium_andersonii.AAC.1